MQPHSVGGTSAVASSLADDIALNSCFDDYNQFLAPPQQQLQQHQIQAAPQGPLAVVDKGGDQFQVTISKKMLMQLQRLSPGPNWFSIGIDRFVVVEPFPKVKPSDVFIKIGQYYFGSSGSWEWANKGVCLRYAEWCDLVEQMDEIKAAVAKAMEDFQRQKSQQ